MNTIYDVMILGAGPAGLTAALYAGRSGLNTLLLEQGQDGGQIALTDEIENYPGQLEGESGAALIARMSAQAERFGGCAGPGRHPLGRADRYGQDPDGASERLSGPRGHSGLRGHTPAHRLQK